MRDKGLRVKSRWTWDDRHTMCDLEDRRINFELLLRLSELPSETSLRWAGAIFLQIYGSKGGGDLSSEASAKVDMSLRKG